MGKILVTGAAGFIGSHTAESLIERGHSVVGVDSFSDYYSSSQKENNIKLVGLKDCFSLVRGDLNEINLKDVLNGVDYVVHLAAQPGVRKSWNDFHRYVRDNINATQRLLDACVGAGVKKVVYASSSSVYGEAELPFREDSTPRPVSPYGVTKLAGENLCAAYQTNHGLPTVLLRYFTVYGPRQRPDMAFNIFIKSILGGKPVNIFGNGEQTRSFTYVSDVVGGTISAMESDCTGVFNIGSNERVSLKNAVDIMGNIIGKDVTLRMESVQKGDVSHTEADTSKASDAFGYCPKVGIREGLKKEVEWVTSSL